MINPNIQINELQTFIDKQKDSLKLKHLEKSKLESQVLSYFKW